MCPPAITSKYLGCHHSAVMVGFMPQDGKGAIELLHKDEPHHLVVERHRRKRNLVGGCLIDARGKAKCSTHDENHLTDAAVHLFLQIFGETYRGMLAPMLVQQHYSIGLVYPPEYLLGLPTLDFLGRGALLVLQCRDDLYLKVGVVRKPLHIDVYALLQVFLVGLGDH